MFAKPGGIVLVSRGYIVLRESGTQNGEAAAPRRTVSNRPVDLYLSNVTVGFRVVLAGPGRTKVQLLRSRRNAGCESSSDKSSFIFIVK